MLRTDLALPPSLALPQRVTDLPERREGGPSSAEVAEAAVVREDGC
jgi:hypothetical protein